ncbi:MAG: UDP-2,4-diacetamido-2,4,6-trideoxy-beta-L-altropyranose hydrolase [Desulfohalobiaceae bacterium]|nr:UDP-2,4-diacetamido-2,4,6-trideoxy-beta-L-altropyranose hydrolase [Desulfohalobiaceae bacterium]
MLIAIRVDSSLHIGTGHVMRCLTLSEALRERGCQVQFICRAHPGHMGDMITKQGFQVSLLPESEQPMNTEPDQEDYAAWLGVSQKEDAQQTIDALDSERPDWLIVDHYGLDIQWENALRPHLSKFMAIDDLANRQHDCDLLLDQNFSLEEIFNQKGTMDTKEEAQRQDLAQGHSRYEDLVPKGCRLLLGPRHALLRPEYSQYRRTMNERTGEIKHVLVFMGGSDSADITGMALEALSVQELAHLEVDVVVGTNNPHKHKIANQVENLPNIHLHASRPHLADLMSRTDLAIGGGGVTTWERMCLGLSSIVICLAENQGPACEALSKAALIHYLGFWKDVAAADLTEKIIDLLQNQELLRFQAKACQTMVDGLGAKRVAEVLHPSEKKDLYLRPAREEDVLIYYDWVNDPVVRQNAFNSEPISLNTHLEWFEKRLVDPETSMFVLMAKDLPVGQIRFELQGDEAAIGYSLDRIVRGRGWGAELVRLGARMISNLCPAVIQCQVKPENQASSAVFMRLGFKELPSQGVRTFRLPCYRIGEAG